MCISLHRYFLIDYIYIYVCMYVNIHVFFTVLIISWRKIIQQSLNLLISGLLHNIFISKRIKNQTLNITQTEGAYVEVLSSHLYMTLTSMGAYRSFVGGKKERRKKKKEKSISIHFFHRLHNSITFIVTSS